MKNDQRGPPAFSISGRWFLHARILSTKPAGSLNPKNWLLVRLEPTTLRLTAERLVAASHRNHKTYTRKTLIFSEIGGDSGGTPAVDGLAPSKYSTAWNLGLESESEVRLKWGTISCLATALVYYYAIHGGTSWKTRLIATRRKHK